MNKARISDTNEIVIADTLSELYPNYRQLEFVCLDEQCSVRMAPACISKKDHRKPHFKKYRNREHIDTCKYAILNELYQVGKNQKLNITQIKKIGLNCPQKVRHYLGAFLWKEKSDTVMNLNFAV